MNRKLLVIAVAALSHGLELDGLETHSMQPVFPALTCTAQATFRTASLPEKHGMIANGVFFRALRKPMFWEQSCRMVEGPRIWKNFRSGGKRVGMLFWQQSLGEDVDILLSPAPIHKHGGGMIQGCYSKPASLYNNLCEQIGRPFKLRQYWGPLASWKVGEWIVDATAAVLENPDLAPELCLTYLPTLDYDLQRNNPDHSQACSVARSKLERQLSRLVQSARAQAYEVLIFGDYHIAPVSDAVMPNVALRHAGLMNCRDVKGMMYFDFYTSRAFALADHEIAHVYISDNRDTPEVRKVMADLPGVGEVLDRREQSQIGLNHRNSGELVIVAEPGKWLAYPWWTEKKEAPEFASHVDIHNKPGYDPCELFFGWPPGSVSRNTARIRGSHGRVGPGRDVIHASTFSIPERPGDLVELATAARRWLDEGA